MIKVIAFLALGVASTGVYAQCSQIIGSGQVVCPTVANSTPPVGFGSSHVNGQTMMGVGQMAVGVGGVVASRGRGPSYVQPGSVNSMAQGITNMQQGVRPPIAVPAPRPKR